MARTRCTSSSPSTACRGCNPRVSAQRQGECVPLIELFAAVADLVLPRWCVGCGEPGPPLCPTCCPRQVVRTSRDGLPVVAASAYEGPVRAAVVAYKERGRRDLARVLGSLLARAARELQLPADAVLVPVPSSPEAIRTRGGDHMLRLARAARLGRPVVGALRLNRVVADSASLDSEGRRANLTGAMHAAPPPTDGRSAVVLDDVVTTGATVAEARRALVSAGWQVHGAVVVAATPLRSRSRHAERGNWR